MGLWFASVFEVVVKIVKLVIVIFLSERKIWYFCSVWCTSITYQWSNELFLPQFEGTLRIGYSFFSWNTQIYITLLNTLVFCKFDCTSFFLGGKKKSLLILFWSPDLAIMFCVRDALNLEHQHLLHCIVQHRHLENSVILFCQLRDWKCVLQASQMVCSVIFMQFWCVSGHQDSSAHPYNW